MGPGLPENTARKKDIHVAAARILNAHAAQRLDLTDHSLHALADSGVAERSIQMV